MSVYPRWYKESLETYVDGRLQSLKAKGFIDNSKTGVWSIVSNAIESEEWDLLRKVSERIQPHKQKVTLNISDLLSTRE